MTKALTILPFDGDKLGPLDYKKLREEGIRHIAALGGDIWTDHNVHDPGITLLEVLCYAMADLGYRTNHDIEDLLALESSGGEDNFFTAAQILTCNPLTILDYRKMLIDIDGVRNAWLVPLKDVLLPAVNTCAADALNGNELFLNGLYEVCLELEHFHPWDNPEDCANYDRDGEVLKVVKKRLHAHRNLCEDFDRIKILKDEEIGICADIELTPGADSEKALLDIYTAVQQFLSPTVNFYTLKELLEKGKTTDEIFEGRPLTFDSHGFIDTDELNQFTQKKMIYTSDLISVVMGVEGVRAVKSLLLINQRGGLRQTDGEPNCIRLSEGHRAMFSPEISTVKFNKGMIPFTVSKSNVIANYYKVLANYKKAKLGADDLDLPIPNGKHRKDLQDYISVKDDLPLTYGTKKGSLPESVPIERKAKALQLQAYLLFFDQLLASYLTQLGNVRKLFSLRPDSLRPLEDQKGSFVNYLDRNPDNQKLIWHFQDEDKEDECIADSEIVAVAGSNAHSDTPEERDLAILRVIHAFKSQGVQLETIALNGEYYYQYKNNLGEVLLRSKDVYESEHDATEEAFKLNYLAIFEESYRKVNDHDQDQFSYQLIYKPKTYQQYLEQITEDAGLYHKRRNQFLDHLLARFAEHFTDYVLLMYALEGRQKAMPEILEDKARFLNNYPDISRNRGRAFNYLDPENTWDTFNISGLENRMSLMMGIDNPQRRYLNCFKPIKTSIPQYIEYRNNRGQLVLKSTEGFTDAILFNEAKDAILKWSEDKINFIPFICDYSKSFGFYLQDGLGNKVATHPLTYGTEEGRDKAMDCVCKLIVGNGWLTSVDAGEAGFYFTLYNNGEVIYKSEQSWSTEAEAWETWFHFLQVAELPENHVITFDAYTKTYELTIQYTGRDGHVEVLAQSPVLLNDETQANQLRDDSVAFFQSKGIKDPVTATSVMYNWQLKDADAKDEFQFDSKLEAARDYLQKEKDGVLDSTDFFIENDLSYQTIVLNAKNKVFLKMVSLYASEEKAFSAWDEIELLALDTANYQIKRVLGEARYRIELWNEKSEVLAISTVQFVNLDDGLSQLDQLIAQLQADPNIAVELSQTKSYAFQIHLEDAPVFISQQVYFTKEDALVAYWSALDMVDWERRYKKTEKESDDKTFSIELRDRANTIFAFHPINYATEEERDKEMEKYLDAFLTYKFPLALLSKVTTYYLSWFDAHCNILLKSIAQYDDPREARKAFYNLLKVASNVDNYSKIQRENNTWTYVLSVDGTPIAEHPHDYPEETIPGYDPALLAANAQLKSWEFEVRESEGFYAYQIYWENCSGGCSVLFNSANEYESPEDAEVELEKLKEDLLEYAQATNDNRNINIEIRPLDADNKYSFAVAAVGAAENDLIATHPVYYETAEERDRIMEKIKPYLLKVNENKINTFDEATAAQTYSSFVLSGSNADEVLLESCQYFSEADICDPDSDLWTDGIQNFALFAQSDSAIVPYIDPHNCEFSFNVVGPAYRMAGHTQRYYTKEKREMACDLLFAYATCNNTLSLNVVPTVCIDKEKFHFAIKAELEGAEDKVIWKSKKSYSSYQKAMDAYEQDYLQIMELARDPDCYAIIKDEAGAYQVNLSNQRGTIMASIPKRFFQTERLQQAIEQAINIARQYPYIHQKEGYGFQLYQMDVVEHEAYEMALSYEESLFLKIRGKLIWVSKSWYKTLDESRDDFEQFLQLLREKENYKPLDMNDCGPFSLELVQSSEVLGKHPASYCSYSELEEAIGRTKACLNNEGFHLLEHILLRPCYDEIVDSESLLVACPDCDALEIIEKPFTQKDICSNGELTGSDLFIPGADSYSFWATIVIPHWPARFQNTNFRKFFEGSLRREVPAHIALRIAWVSPFQMWDFERKYRAWLEAKALGGESCDLKKRKLELTNCIENLRNVYPPGVVHDCETGDAGDALFVFDQSQLT